MHHLTILIICLMLGISGCIQPLPLDIDSEPTLPASDLTTAASSAAQSPFQSETPYLLTTADFANEEGYLTVTRTGAGLMQIRRPRYEIEQTAWLFTPAGDDAYYLRLADQEGDWVYNHELVAVEMSAAEDQRWHVTPLNDGAYRFTNLALGPDQSLATIGEGMPYPGWGEVIFTDSVDVASQQWLLEALPPPEVAADEDEPPARGAAGDDDEPPARGTAGDDDEPPARGTAAVVDTTFPFEDFGVWQRGDKPYGEFVQSQEQAIAGSSGKLHYDFSLVGEGDDFVLFTQQWPIGGEPNAIKAQIFGDGAGHVFSVWVADAGGEVWSIGLGPVSGAGWQELSGVIDPAAGWPTGYISGPQDGKIDYPIQLVGLLLDRVDLNAPPVGDIFIDDLTFTVGPGLSPPVADTAGEAETATAEEATDGGQAETTTPDDTAAEGGEAAQPVETEAAPPTSEVATSGYGYELIPLEGGRDSRPAAEHADLNLDIRGLQPLDAALGFVETNGDSDPYAPNFLGVLEPNFVGAYTTQDWDWGCNCPVGPIEYPWGQVAAVEFATTPGKELYILPREHNIYQGKFYATLLYATENSLTYIYTREGNIANGYAIHYWGLDTDPNLLQLYRESSDDVLPGLTLDTPVGRARDTLIVGIRDRGAFMDPRNHENWWLERGLPRPPGR